MQDALAADGDERVSRTLFCKGLTQQVTQSILYELFLIAGPIQGIHLPRARPWEAKVAEPKPDEGEGTAGRGERADRPSQSGRVGGEGESIDDERDALPDVNPVEKPAEDLLVVKCEDPDRRSRDVDRDALSVDGESGSTDARSNGAKRKDQDVVSSQNSPNSEEKPFSVEDKILYRYRVGEHQGFAFIVYCHVQSVDYAMNIFRGTKLFGSQISMSPAMQAMDKAREYSKLYEKGGNTAKSKTESRQRQGSVQSHRNVPRVGKNRESSNRNLNLKRDQTAHDRYNNNASWNGARVAQNIPHGNNYWGTAVYGSRNWQNNPCVDNAPRTVQGNWRIRSDGNNRGFVTDPEATPGTYDSNRGQGQYWRGRHSTHDEWARNSYGNMPPRSQTRSFRGSQRKTVLHASIPRLGRGRLKTCNPIIESGSFLSLTPNLAQHGCDPPYEPPLVAPGYECSPVVVNPCHTPFQQDTPQDGSPLTLNSDEHIPILYYEMDTKPDIQTFSSNVYVDGQTGTENWDSSCLTGDTAHLMASLTLNEDESTPEEHWGGEGAEQFAHLVSNGLPAPQLHYQHYSNDEEFSSCGQTSVTDSPTTFNEMQYLDPMHLNNPYVQTQSGGYGTEYEQWQPEYPHTMQGHLLNGQQVDQFSEPSQQIVNQLRLLNLGYDPSGRPAEPSSYTRVFGQGIEHDPAMMTYSQDLAPVCQNAQFPGVEWQNEPAYIGQNINEFLHRSQSVPCHISHTKSVLCSRARATHSSGHMEEPRNGHWVSPVAWKTKNQSTWPSPDQCGTQRKPDRHFANRGNRSSRNFSPLTNKPPVSSPQSGSSKKPERRYTLSECIDNAFEVYHQSNAVNSPRSKPTGVSTRKSGPF